MGLLQCDVRLTELEIHIHITLQLIWRPANQSELPLRLGGLHILLHECPCIKGDR